MINEITNREYLITLLENYKLKDLNIFSEAIQAAENEIDGELYEIKNRIDEINRKIPPVVNRQPTEEHYEIWDELSEEYFEQSLKSDYLNAFAEMKVIYFFKNLEINMKSLIVLAYPNVITKGFYKWENMISFFKSIDIDVSKISGYNEAMLLKQLNNSIKHSEVINNDLKRIPEFSSIEYFTPEAINLFLERIEDNVKLFFKSLIDEIIKERFEFDDTKMDKISEDLYNRMDKETFEKFSESITSKLSK